ncbi:MAG: arginine--tRNA ligase [Phycisphaerae bacterium]
MNMELARRVADAIKHLGVEADPLIRPVQDPRFGHYQSNCAMGLAKRLGRKPRDVATSLVEHLDVADMCDRPEIAGPGFINFRLTPVYMAAALSAIPRADDPRHDRLGIAPTATPEVVVVDLSSPNLAKEMHVGHLRSTVIGDCIARILEFAGHTVHRENHVGDWGTQFGMLVAYLRRTDPDIARHPDNLAIGDLETFYVRAKSLFDADEGFRTASRDAVVALQRGDEETRRIWRAFCDESLRHCHRIYERLGVRLIDRGESFYNDYMADVTRRLEDMMRAAPDGPVRISEGALCVFTDGFATRDGAPLPLIVRKSDGGFNYATSDLAAILHRMEHVGADRIIYVVGMSQSQHFAMVFAAARRVGWVAPEKTLQHLGFGNMLGDAGRPFKTRDGGTIKLKDLLDEAVARARRVVEAAQGSDTGPTRRYTSDVIDRIAETVGIGAIKYFDLSHALAGDYKFDFDTMLSLEGNTAPYMLYAYARVRAIGRRAGVDLATLPADAPITLEHPSEIALAVVLLRFAEVVETAGRELRPNVLTDYLFELAKAFSRFYDKKLGVRIVDASPPARRVSRLKLCDLTARTLAVSLRLLGIETLEQM